MMIRDTDFPDWTKELFELTGVRLTAEQERQFAVFERELLAWNEQFNLTSIKDPRGVQVRHFLDSLSCLLAFEAGKLPKSLVDVGTGAGFPGIPLKIVLPKLKLTLVESVGKKARFCEHMVKVLNLSDVLVVAERAEDLGQNPEHREEYETAVGRAVAAAPVLAEYLLPLVKPGGVALMPRGEAAETEAEAAVGAFRKLGGDLERVIPVVLPEVEGRRALVVVKKNARTPKLYPRKPGTPNKNPLT